MREISNVEIQFISGGLSLEGDVYYDMGHAVGEAYAWAVDSTSRAIEWVANHI